MGRPRKSDSESDMRPIGLPPALTERLRAASMLYNKGKAVTYTGKVDEEMKGEYIQSFSSDNEVAIHYIRIGLIRAKVIEGLEMFLPEGPKFDTMPPIIEENLTRLVIRIPETLQDYLVTFVKKGGFQSPGFAVRFLIEHGLKKDGLIPYDDAVLMNMATSK